MPDKIKGTTGTGESPRVYGEDVRYRRETMQALHLPEQELDAGASTGVMPVIGEPGDEDALREADSPDNRYSK